MICPKCGAENPDGTLLCNGCGSVIDTSGPLSEVEMHTAEKVDGHVKYVFKTKKEKKGNGNALQPPKPDTKKHSSIGIGVKRQGFFSNDSQSESKVDISEALKQEERVPYSVNTEYKNRFISDLPEEVEEAKEILPPDPTRGNFILLGLLGLAILVIVLISTKLKNMAIYFEAVDTIKDGIGDIPLANVIPFLIYVLLIFGISYDTFKSRELSLRKVMTKNVIISLVVSLVLVVMYEGFGGFAIGDTYFKILLRFIIFFAILGVNNYIKKYIYDIERKMGINNILFEFLIYFDLFTLVLLIFF